MDLLSTVRKSGSRGGVNFSWDDVSTSTHRENYLGHSLKAPVGRWQKGRDLNWYAKADGEDDPNADPAETDQEKSERLRKEELRAIKEAEEDALARALGLPVAQRDTSGANAVEVAPSRMIGAAGPPEEPAPAMKGGLQVKEDRKEGRERRHRDHHDERRERRRHRSRSRDREREGRHRHRDDERRHERSRRTDDRRRSRSPERERRRHRDGDRDRDEDSSRRHRRDKERSRSRDGGRNRDRERRDREHRQGSRNRSREHQRPQPRDHRRSPSARDH